MLAENSSLAKHILNSQHDPIGTANSTEYFSGLNTNRFEVDSHFKNNGEGLASHKQNLYRKIHRY